MLIFLSLMVTISSVFTQHITDDISLHKVSKLAKQYPHEAQNLNFLVEEFNFQNKSVFKNPHLALEKLRNISNSTVSVNCIRDSIAALIGLVKVKPWALKMLDAFGKVGSGLSGGNFIWPGSFSVCNNVTQGPPYGNRSQNDVRPFHGQFCWLQVTPNFTTLAIPAAAQSFLSLRTAMCVPDSCSSEDVSILFDYINDIPDFNDYATVNTVCIPRDRSVWNDTRAIICLVFCFIMLLILLSGTFYDMSLQFVSSTNNKRQINPQHQHHEKLGHKDIIESDVPILHEHCTDNNLVVNDDVPLILVEEANRPNVWSKVLLSFSYYTNGSKLFSCSPRDNSLMCLNGIRVFSMLWVIFGHTYMIGALGSNNILEVVPWLQKFTFLFISQGVYSVDTFFLLSGLLVTYLYLKEYEKREGKISWLKFYLHRYWRLTPVYAVVLFIFANILSPYYVYGPFWPLNGVNGDHCDKSWWLNLLYINNFQPNADMCMGHTWYLANDMQFFVISPLILIFITRYLPISAAIAGGFILTNWIATGTLSSYYGIGGGIVEGVNGDMFNTIYDKPYTRIAPYIIGMICGYLLIEGKCQKKLNKIVVVIGWLLAFGVSSSVMFGTYKADLTQDAISLYNALSRSGWAVAVSWMIYACCNGYGGIVNSILSWPFWQPFGRLTYSTYLIHLVIIRLFFLGSEDPVHFSHLLMISTFLGSAICSYFAAVFLSLSFEAPFLALEKLIF